MLLWAEVLRFPAASRAQRAPDAGGKRAQHKFLSAVCCARQLVLSLGPCSQAVQCPVSCGQSVPCLAGDDTYLKTQQGEQKGSDCFASGAIAADNAELCCLGWNWDSKPRSHRENYFLDLLPFLSSWELTVLWIVALFDYLYSCSTWASPRRCICCGLLCVAFLFHKFSQTSSILLVMR